MNLEKSERSKYEYYDIFKWREEAMDYGDWFEFWQIENVYAPDNDLFGWNDNLIWLEY